MHFKRYFRISIVAALAVMMLNVYAEGLGRGESPVSYMKADVRGVEFIVLLSAGNMVNGYAMAGIPDGLGAYDNKDGTFTVLMNHEIYADANGPVGVVRAHGGAGAFVSEWVIDKRTLKVISGADLMKSVYQQEHHGGVWQPVPAAGTLGKTSSFARLCSGDLAEREAFFNKATRRGSRHRIYLNGEEGAPLYQRGLAHVVTGPDRGNTYVLPWASDANGAWENLLANPYSGDNTVVIGNADGGSNGVYVYVGKKRKEGNDIEKAGLIGGSLYRVAVSGNQPETRAADAGLGLTKNARGHYAGVFTLVAGADVANTSSTRFLRPEDGAWDKKKRNRYFFVTTDRMDAAKDGNLNPDVDAGQSGRSRLWALNFTDSARPELGGTLEMLLDGTTSQGNYQMLDNMTVNDDGSILLQEDVGDNQHNGKLWRFDPDDGSLVKLAGFDTSLFGDIGVAAAITKDEESSGVIDITHILGRRDGKIYNLLVAQNHASSGDVKTVQGGQLLLMVHSARKHIGRATPATKALR